MKNDTIEERVTLLELQVTELEEDVDFLFDDQLIQDERLFSLEEETDDNAGEIVTIENEIESM